MNIQVADKMLNKIGLLLNLINNKIGVITAKKWFYSQPDYELNISIKCDDVKHNKVGNFIIDKIYSYLLASEYNDKYFYIGEFRSNYEEKEEVGFTLVFNFDKDELNRCKKIFDELVTALYFAVDEAKVEFGFHIEEANEHEIPNEIFWELDTWNEGWIEDGEEDKCVPDDAIKVYSFKKDWLYSICLGYYAIDLTLFETDIVPELIGILFESTEDFCYVTSYEDEENVYLYSVKELNEDNVFDIEEGLFNLLGLISVAKDDTEDTLEDYFSNIKGKDSEEK